VATAGWATGLGATGAIGARIDAGLVSTSGGSEAFTLMNWFAANSQPFEAKAMLLLVGIASRDSMDSF